MARRAGKLFHAMVVEYVLLSVVGFTLKLFYVSRLLALLFVGINFLLLLLARSLLGPVLLRRVQRESLRVVIVGTGEKALSLTSVLSENPPLGISILGFLAEKPSESEELEGRPILGGLDDARSVLINYVVDKVPQLFNVLKGEMNLVGPSPPLPEEVEWYQPWQSRRLSMKPGITCLCQVSGRSDLSFNEWVELDLRYIDNWSPWLDVKILLKTVPAVLFARGLGSPAGGRTGDRQR